MRFLLILLCFCFAAFSTTCCNAGFIVNINQVGNDVVAVGSGSLNVSALTFLSSGTFPSNIVPASGLYRGGVGDVLFSATNSIVGPLNFGTGNVNNIANIATGDQVGITAFNGRLFVPVGYVSGNSLSHTSVWTNQSFATLGLAEGTYVYSWGTGPNADSLTINASITAVPEPSALTMTFLAAIAGCSWLRRKKASSAFEGRIDTIN
jgi:hypothetical protein